MWIHPGYSDRSTDEQKKYGYTQGILIDKTGKYEYRGFSDRQIGKYSYTQGILIDKQAHMAIPRCSDRQTGKYCYTKAVLSK